MKIFTKNWCNEHGKHTARIDGKIKDGEIRGNGLQMVWIELIPAKGTHTRFNSTGPKGHQHQTKQKQKMRILHTWKRRPRQDCHPSTINHRQQQNRPKAAQKRI